MTGKGIISDAFHSGRQTLGRFLARIFNQNTVSNSNAVGCLIFHPFRTFQRITAQFINGIRYHDIFEQGTVKEGILFHRNHAVGQFHAPQSRTAGKSGFPDVHNAFLQNQRFQCRTIHKSPFADGFHVTADIRFFQGLTAHESIGINVFHRTRNFKLLNGLIGHESRSADFRHLILIHHRRYGYIQAFAVILNNFRTLAVLHHLKDKITVIKNSGGLNLYRSSRHQP